MIKVLIVGCGYVGNHLAECLVKQNHKVWGIRRDITYVSPVVKGISADINSITVSQLPLVDYVIYLVSADNKSTDAYQLAYHDGISRLISEYKKHHSPPKKFIFASSTSVYEVTDGSWVDENSPCDPQQETGKILRAGENVLANSGFDFSIVRFAGIYGPNRHYLLDKVLAGDVNITLKANYSNRIHRDDCAGIIMHLMRLIINDGIYIGVDCEPTPINTIVGWLSGRVGKKLAEGKSITSPDPGDMNSNKRCSNAHLLHSNYQFIFPHYRDGFRVILHEKGLL